MKLAREIYSTSIVASDINYINFVVPAKAGIQEGYWMPEQVRHDGFRYLVARLIIATKSRKIKIFPITLFQRKYFISFQEVSNHGHNIHIFMGQCPDIINKHINLPA